MSVALASIGVSFNHLFFERDDLLGENFRVGAIERQAILNGERTLRNAERDRAGNKRQRQARDRDRGGESDVVSTREILRARGECGYLARARICSSLSSSRPFARGIDREVRVSVVVVDADRRRTSFVHESSSWLLRSAVTGLRYSSASCSNFTATVRWT